MVFIKMQRDYPRFLGAQNLNAKTIVFLTLSATSLRQILQSSGSVLGVEAAHVYVQRRQSC